MVLHFFRKITTLLLLLTRTATAWAETGVEPRRVVLGSSDCWAIETFSETVFFFFWNGNHICDILKLQ